MQPCRHRRRGGTEEPVFIVGGRRGESELFRVTYVGAESTEPVDRTTASWPSCGPAAKDRIYQAAPLTGGRQGGGLPGSTVGHADQAHSLCRSRVAGTYHAQVLARTSARGQRARHRDHRRDWPVHVVDSPQQPKLLAALDRLEFGRLTQRQQLDALRAWSLAFIRLGPPDAQAAARLAAKLDPFYPAQGEAASRDFLNRELCEMLVFLKSPGVAAKTVALLKQPSAGVAPPPPPPSNPAYAKSRGKTFGKS